MCIRDRIDPRIARMIIAAGSEGVMKEVLIIASALSIQDPRERPLDKAEAADAAHEKFRHPHSDFLTFLKLWGYFQAERKQLSQSKLRKWCQENFLSFVRLREWEDVHSQLAEIARDLNLENDQPKGAAPRRQRQPQRSGRRPG